MINRITRIAGAGVFVFALFLSSCGPSAEERRQQEIEDSLKLEQDRRELLERANRMFEADTSAGEEKAETEEVE